MLPSQSPGTIQQAVEDIRIAGIYTGRVKRIAAVSGHEMKIAVVGIAEEGVDIDVACALPATAQIAIRNGRATLTVEVEINISIISYYIVN